ncbi:unnamed protein product [Gordionus sp. m RMFG-2023]|uniref:uncharacterized protein LOC135925991 isoform X1 n=2 Tax=Gordionus sp. m RMFG-2023 TaxID=3053472 RepID=UPI0030E5C76C
MDLQKANCQICNIRTYKYKCPQCEICTCSLDCVKKHKKEYDCEGNNYRTKYIPMSKFDNLTLLSDYRFLEGINRDLESSNRNHWLHPFDLPKRVTIMKRFARSQRIFLRIMSYGMSRHAENTTIFDMKTKKFLWHVKWVFPSINYCHHEKRVPEQTLLKDLLDKFLSECLDNTSISRGTKDNNITKSHNDYYVYMKNECRQSHQLKRWHFIDLAKSLKFNLFKKVILEYPVLHIVSKSDVFFLNSVYDPTGERYKEESMVLLDTDTVLMNPQMEEEPMVLRYTDTALTNPQLEEHLLLLDTDILLTNSQTKERLALPDTDHGLTNPKVEEEPMVLGYADIALTKAKLEKHVALLDTDILLMTSQTKELVTLPDTDHRLTNPKVEEEPMVLGYADTMKTKLEEHVALLDTDIVLMNSQTKEFVALPDTDNVLTNPKVEKEPMILGYDDTPLMKAKLDEHVALPDTDNILSNPKVEEEPMVLGYADTALMKAKLEEHVALLDNDIVLMNLQTKEPVAILDADAILTNTQVEKVPRYTDTILMNPQVEEEPLVLRNADTAITKSQLEEHITLLDTDTVLTYPNDDEESMIPSLYRHFANEATNI